MKSYINKLFLGAAVVSMLGLGSCVNDLDQLPEDPRTTTGANIKENPQEYLAGMAAKCYSGMAVSGQGGPNGESDISGLDGGTSQYTRGLFMLNEFPTDEVMWIYQDAGVPDLVQANWGTSNVVIFGIYSRLYTHIAICNDFLRLTTDSSLETLGVPMTDDLRALVKQLRLEARALRAMSYYNIIDLFGNAVVAWDDAAYGEVPQQTTRKELYDKVLADLEDVYKNFSTATPVYGRIGIDAVEGLLCRFYLNAGVFTGTDNYAKCWEHAQNIIARHAGKGFNGTGLANDYLALFCGNNDKFMPGGALADQNEILWGIPYDATFTQPWGGTTFLIFAALKNAADVEVGNGFCAPVYYGVQDAWGCMHARQQFSEKFNLASDYRTKLWVTEAAGYSITNDVYASFESGYLPIKFTNVECAADGTMPIWADQTTGLTRAGVRNEDGTINSAYNFPNTDLPLIRLADVYLMAAEAALNGAGDKAKGLEYVNNVRTRAGLSAWNSLEYTASNLLDERSRELYWENVRRTDLIRNGKFTGNAYVWNWKNNAPKGGSIGAFRNLYPIPADVIATYGSSYKQNPGY